ncbi:hypothetical protein EAT51_07715 [Pseudoxanthomonas winnipegensis]|uniref:hypothetical protein n=1 Tax=Pseudoxanthomonas winnipegensis TaxID=2480810 RepID=UPI00102E0920|nr:hypothetical protein [Pseudoxanthomonas winnipegensis]TAA42150.1 hypothetical protein EAT51_07715 [Pseudoxanthomonas winnipegensis]
MGREASKSVPPNAAILRPWRIKDGCAVHFIRHRARIAFGDSDDPRAVIDAARAAREGGDG